MAIAKERLKKLRDLMAKYGLDAFVFTDSDPNAGEYSAAHWKTRSWLSGFTGSNGTLVVTPCEAALWTDGRYYIQAQSQLEGSGIAMMRGGEPDVPDCQAWIAERARPGAKVGVDGGTFTCAEYNKLKEALEGRGAEIEIGYDLAGMLWAEKTEGGASGGFPEGFRTEGRPALPSDPIFSHELKYAGKPASEKIREAREELRRRNASYALICGLEDVAWLFNIRGADIDYLPVAYSHAFISPDSAELYIDARKVPDGVRETLRGQGVGVFDSSELPGRLGRLKAGDRISCDPGKLNKRLQSAIPAGAHAVYAPEPTVQLKAIKNEAEIAAHREAQLYDGAAMVRFMMWLERETGAGAGAGACANDGAAISEWDASLALSRFRAQAPECRGDSFNAIVAYGANGAMMHYAPKPGASSQIRGSGLMVVDSGGHYGGGTTDITRTIVLGETTAEERGDFTLTLKSHIALASARFLYGATGAHVDSIARKVMWDNGLDYKCGTGHGIGSYLSVHEGPQSISMRAGTGARLEENMIVSIEPGVYREGRHGVRIENLARIAEDITNEFGRFLRFETLTFCPIGLAGVEPAMLTEFERKWLNGYHAAVYGKLSPLLGEPERAWLARETRPI